MSALSVRFAEPPDYSQIVRLNSDNLWENISPEDRVDGFLSALFSERQVAAMAADLGIAIAVDGNRVVAFLCAFRRDYDHGSPVVSAMLDAFDRLRFEERPLTEFNAYIYGPVCIERGYRRRGLLRALFEAQQSALAGRFEIGVALIARDNRHSMEAHVEGLKMTGAGDFEVRGKRFAAVAFRLPAPR